MPLGKQQGRGTAPAALGVIIDRTALAAPVSASRAPRPIANRRDIALLSTAAVAFRGAGSSTKPAPVYSTRSGMSSLRTPGRAPTARHPPNGRDEIYCFALNCSAVFFLAVPM